MLGVENITFEIQEEAGDLALLGIGSCEGLIAAETGDTLFFSSPHHPAIAVIIFAHGITLF